jgi:hypothetical protein
MQIRFIACDYQNPFYYLQKGSGYPFETFSLVMDTLLKEFACGLHKRFYYTISVASLLDEL